MIPYRYEDECLSEKSVIAEQKEESKKPVTVAKAGWLMASIATFFGRRPKIETPNEHIFESIKNHQL